MKFESALTNNEALKVLHDELEREVQQYKDYLDKKKWRKQFNLLKPSNIRSCFHWSGAVLLAVMCCGLLIAIIGDASRLVHKSS